MSFRPRDFRRSTWVRAWRSAALWLCVVTLALQPLASLAAIRQQTPVAIGAPAATSAGPSVQLLWGTRTAEYAEKDISFAAVSAVGFTPRPPQLAPLPSPPRQSLTLSGAQPPYPPNHVLDGSVEVVGTPPQGAVGYAYNDAGQRTGMTLPGGRTVGYGYDAAGRLSSVSDWQGGAATLGYDVDGSLSSVTRSSGVATSYGYDGAGRLSAVSHSGPTGTLQSYVYALDANGNRTGVTTQTGSESYGYDALNRLTSVGYTNGDTVSYGYDAAGKRLTETFNGVTTTYDYDAAGQVVSNGVLSYTYDANGNLTGAGSDAYAWDWANRLVGASVGNSTIAYGYDALGVRTGAVVDGVANSFLWDRVTGQLVDDGGQGYVQAPGVLAQLGAAGRGDLLADGTGSVRGIADANGLLVGAADFGVFGQNRGQAGVTSSVGSGGAFWTAALRDQSQAPAGLVSAALFGALPTPTGSGGSNSVSTALAHLERLQQVNPTPNRFVGSAGDTESDGASWGGFGGGGAPVGSPALALLLPQANDPEPANQLPGPYTYASHPPMQGSGGTSALPGANPSLFAAWLLGLEASEDPGGLIGLGQAIVRVFLYVAFVLDGECLASLTELQALTDELGSAAQVTMRWTGRLLIRAAEMWPLLPNIPRPLAELMSLGLGFVPVVGDLLDLYAGLTGYDPITGERLPAWAQALAIGAAFLPMVSASQLRYADDALSYADEALEFEQDAGRFIGRACSFSAETTVQMADGPRAIARVEAGDQVLAWDEQSETIGYYTVTAVWTHTDPTVVRLTIDDEIIETTPEHPFFVTAEGWTPAETLTIGDRVRKANGDAGVVQRVTFTDRPHTMHNLTVADAHTFFVGDGQWLVHNACRWLGEGDAPSHGEALAHFADEVHRQITRYWPKRQSTTAVAEIDGQIYVSSHGDSRAAKDLVDISLQEGYTYVASGADHAEVALYEILHGSPDFIGIGVSHRSGPCPICQNFFFERGYVDVFWTGEWTH